VGALAYHLAFDERLTTGLNPALAAACGWGAPEVLGEKEGRPLGMICELPQERAFGTEAQRLREQFNGLEQIAPPAGGSGAVIARVAVVGAMTDTLVRAAHAAGAGLYATGQWRQPARAAVRETGIGVVAIGHRRSEEWGLQALARLLTESATAEGRELTAVIAPHDPLA
jgi:putative NIF3 family GTP cyclohydrolase 1 type 2